MRIVELTLTTYMGTVIWSSPPYVKHTLRRFSTQPPFE